MTSPLRTTASGRGPQGFTLIELVVTVSVLAVVLAIAIPSFRGLISSNRISGSTNEMVALLQLAKVEAVRRNVVVDVCPVANATTTTCASSGNWSLVSVIARHPTAEVVRTYAAPAQLTLRASSNINSAATQYKISFRPDGFAWRGTATPTTRLVGRVQVCEATTNPAQNARNILLSGARITVEAPLTSNGCTAAPNN